MPSKEECAYALALEQGSAEWLDYKIGKIGASKIADVTAKLRSGGYGASRATYRGELIAERLTGVASESFKTPAMQWGNEHEAMARSTYQFRTMHLVERVGCVLHPEIEDTLCSPDGLVGSDGLIEIKCPLTATHIDFVLGAKIPERYLLQMQWQLACTHRDWCDYVSFDPRLPDDLRFWCERIPRDDKLIKMLTDEVKGFVLELEAHIEALRKLRRRKEAA